MDEAIFTDSKGHLVTNSTHSQPSGWKQIVISSGENSPVWLTFLVSLVVCEHSYLLRHRCDIVWEHILDWEPILEPSVSDLGVAIKSEPLGSGRVCVVEAVV